MTGCLWGELLGTLLEIYGLLCMMYISFTPLWDTVSNPLAHELSPQVYSAPDLQVKLPLLLWMTVTDEFSYVLFSQCHTTLTRDFFGHWRVKHNVNIPFDLKDVNVLYVKSVSL